MKSRYKVSRKFDLDFSSFNSTNPKKLYKDLKEIVSKWDFKHRWNYESNLILYRQIYEKYPFINYSYIQAVRDNQSICCIKCGTLLKSPFENKSKCCPKCKDKLESRCKKISNSKLNASEGQKLSSIQKRMNTTFKKYGVYNVSNLLEIQQKISKAQKGIPRPLNNSMIEIANLHRHQTHKINNTFKSSAPENFSTWFLSLLFKDIKTQFYSDKYPFNCDCYLPEQDLFIEFNYSWTHGNHPYDEILDKSVLDKMLESNSLYMKNAIETWTIRDVKKRETAKENSLNYLEFFNIEEFMDWLFRNYNTLIQQIFPGLTRDKLKIAYLCYSRSGKIKDIPNFYLNNKLIVKTNKRLEENFYLDWCNSDKRLQVIEYMLKQRLDLLTEIYLSNFAACFFESKITPKLIEGD